MSRLEKAFAAKSPVFMPFLVIGDPDLETSMELAESLIRGGADLLEFGMPFSDPPADGPVIQAADVRALASGTNTDRAFEFLRDLRAKTELPIVLLLYYNLVFRYGVERFYGAAAEAGVDGILIADLPVEEAERSLKAAKTAGIAPIFIVSALASEARIKKILPHAQGFLYLVARIGITGEQRAFDSSLSEVIRRIRRQTELPLLAGFGLSTPEHARLAIDAGADGVICGSAIVGRIQAHLGDRPTMLSTIEGFAAQMKDATMAKV